MSHQNQYAIELYSLTYLELVQLLAGWGYSHYFADKLWKSLYVQRVESLDQITDLRADLLDALKLNTFLETPVTIDVQESADGLTKKYLLGLSDGESIECVTMEYDGRTTACISSQVGCAMGCVFCATGQMGFRRNLTSGEIVAQIVYLLRSHDRDNDRIRNVVFMGMGEPFHNYRATLTAIDIMVDGKGLAIGPRYVTVSTVGLPSAIRQFATEVYPVNLAVSLHAATDEERRKLVPISERWSLDDVMDACREYHDKRGRRIFFEWALISGKNDAEEQAHALGNLLQDIDGHVNLIPINPTNGYDAATSDEHRAIEFRRILSLYDIPSTIRRKRGIDIFAGCGQLRTQNESRSTSSGNEKAGYQAS